VKRYSRPGNDLTKRFPLIVEAVTRLRPRFCIIGRVTWGCVLRRPPPRPPGPDAGSRACSPLRPVSRSPWPMKKRFFVMHITSRARRIR
jgi:hypothetical protein